MSYVVFARKWRPKDFDEVIGQKHITHTLKSAIHKEKVAHAYLFTGPRGIGKTSTARILSKALNCESSKSPTPKPCNKCNNCLTISEGRNFDVIEIDGASNRGIDEVRQLRESVKFAPAQSRFKIYIIDEVHMLTPEAFNALLKTLEEPPPYVKFIFATTNPDKVLATVLSRCQRFDFRRIAIVEIIEKLKEVATAEKIKADDEAFFYIAKASDGSLRDAESILDQLSSLTEKIDIASVNNVLGLIKEDIIFEFVDLLIKKDAQRALEIIDDLVNQGKDIQLFLNSLIEHFRNLIISKVADKYFKKIVDLPLELQERAAEQSKSASYEFLAACFKELLNSQEAIKRSDAKRIILEVAIVALAGTDKPLSLKENIITKEELKVKIIDAVSPNKFTPKPEGQDNSFKSFDKTYYKAPEEDAVEQGSVSTQTEVAAESEKKVSASHVESIWENAVENIKSQRMSIGTYLSEGALLAVENNIINVGFSRENKFHKEFLEKKDNLALLEKAFSNLLDASVKVILKTIEAPKANFQGSPNNGGAKPEPKKDGVENFIQSAIDTFNGKFV